MKSDGAARGDARLCVQKRKPNKSTKILLSTRNRSIEVKHLIIYVYRTNKTIDLRSLPWHVIRKKFFKRIDQLTPVGKQKLPEKNKYCTMNSA